HLGGEDEAEDEQRHDRHGDEDGDRERIAQRRQNLAPHQRPESSPAHAAFSSSWCTAFDSRRTRRNTSVISDWRMCTRAPPISVLIFCSSASNAASSACAANETPAPFGSPR